jgi:hypothetical protein
MDAFNKIVAKSSLGSNYLAYGARDYNKELSDNLQGGSGSPASDDSQNHQDSSNFNFDPTKGGQSEVRFITIKEQLSIEEQGIFEQRLEELSSSGAISNSMTSYSVNAFKNIDKSFTLRATYARESGLDQFKIKGSFDFESLNDKTVYPCASLIELLLVLKQKIYIQGSFDLNRGQMIKSGKDIADGKELNDHTCGRGIDIGFIGNTESSKIDLTKANEKNNREALLVLLEQLNVIDPSLHPDLIVFDPRLATEFGIIKGHWELDSNWNAGVNGIIQKKYPSLGKIDFSTDDGHKDHIHMSFSPQRAGTYLDYTIPESGSTWSPSNPDGTSSPYLFSSPSQALIYEPELYQSAISDPEKVMKNQNALYRALIEFGKFKPQQAALFMAITERESNFQPGGFNGKISDGDYSFGFWQVNFYGKGVSERLDMFVNVPTLLNGKISIKKVKLLHLVFKDHVSLGIETKEQATAKMENIFKTEGERAGRNYANPVLFYPAVQVQLLKLITDSPGNPNWKFSPWGEYGGGPAYGWITKLKFKTAVKFYVENNPGKTEEDLKSFCRPFVDNMKKYSPEGIEVYNQWLDGVVFGG